VKCSDLTEKQISKVKEILSDVFKEALSNRPSIVILDDIDLLLPGSQEQEVRIHFSFLIAFRY
jgi:SpoVK/Ycf46/Vps4 family AAA+-type ATPase